MINVVFGINDDISCVKKQDSKDILSFVKALYENFIQIHFKDLKIDFFEQRVRILGFFDSDFNFIKIDDFFLLSDFSEYLRLKNRFDVDNNCKGDLKRSEAVFAKSKSGSVVKLSTDKEVKEYVDTMKGVKNEV